MRKFKYILYYVHLVTCGLFVILGVVMIVFANHIPLLVAFMGLYGGFQLLRVLIYKLSGIDNFTGKAKELENG